LKDFAVTDRRDESRPHLFHPGGGSYRPAPVGAGVAPIEDLVRALEAARYSGFLSIEYEGEDPSPADAVESSLRYIRSLEGAPASGSGLGRREDS
jgi:sugar phosphate isomerase/epimerase